MAGNPTELRATMAEIEADPRSWDQGYVVHDTGCGSTFCFAGHTLKRKGYKPDGDSGHYWIRSTDSASVDAIDEAVNLLGLPDDIGDPVISVLFFRSGVDTVPKMRELVEAIIGDDREIIERYL